MVGHDPPLWELLVYSTRESYRWYLINRNKTILLPEQICNGYVFDSDTQMTLYLDWTCADQLEMDLNKMERLLFPRFFHLVCIYLYSKLKCFLKSHLFDFLYVACTDAMCMLKSCLTYQIGWALSSCGGRARFLWGIFLKQIFRCSQHLSVYLLLREFNSWNR